MEPGRSTFLLNDLTLNSGASGVRCTSSGTATSEGALTLSRDKRFLTIGGYDAAAGAAGVVASAASRGAARIDMNQNAVVTAFTDAFTTNNIRSTVSDDGSQVWMAGANQGIRYGTTGSTTTLISSAITNNRVMNFTGSELMFSTGSGANRGIYTLGSPAPTSGPVAATVVINTGGSSSNYDFLFASATVCYIADDTTNATGGIQKWTFNGSAWTQAFVIGSGAVNIGARGLTGTVDGSGNVQLYAITAEGSANRLIGVSDTLANTATPPTAATLATAGTNTIFRGVDFAPVAAPGSAALLAIGGLLAARRRR